MAENRTFVELLEQLPEEYRTSLDDLARAAAQRMIAVALEEEAGDYVARHASERDGSGRALVVRNGHALPRRVAMGAGMVEVETPRIHDRRPDEHFTSAILPPYMRRSPRLEEALPILYLRGLSTGDIGPALKVLLGEAAAGMSASTIGRLKQVWEGEYDVWRRRDLSGKRYVYAWADGVNFPVRLEQDRLTCLVVIAVTEDGSKELVALTEGYRESDESWTATLRDLRRRGMNCPVVIAGDGIPSLWNAVEEVFPPSRQQRCWRHKMANILDKLPKRVQSRAKDQLDQIVGAETREAALEEAHLFKEQFEAKYPKATACLFDDLDNLLTFFDFPAQHWVHLRTTNPIESTFATVKHRTRRTKGSGSRGAGLAMAFKLADAAQDRWRRINAPHLAAAVLAGVRFRNGVPILADRQQPQETTLQRDAA